MAAAKTSKSTKLTQNTLGDSPSVTVVVEISDASNTSTTVSDHIASSSQINQGTIAVAQESFVRTDVGVQSQLNTDKLIQTLARREAKISKRLSVDTIEILSARVAELEATVARLVGCYPICSPTPTPTRTPAQTPTKTPTPSVTKTPTPTPTKIFEISSTPAATPTKTVTPIVTATPSVTQTVTPSVTVTPTPSTSNPLGVYA